MQLARVYRKLEQAAFRVTPQRDRVIETFYRHAGEALSAEDIERLVRTESPLRVGLATIYRTIEILVDLGVVSRVNTGDGRARYQINEDAVHQRHHLVCIRCGQVEEFSAHLLDGVEARILADRGFHVMDHELKFYGLCAICRPGTEEVHV
jgi:Fur family ferric uptake transcriptional regulator